MNFSCIKIGFGSKLMKLTGLNLDLFYIRQSNAAPFCKNYAKFYFDAKHLEKGLNRGW